MTRHTCKFWARNRVTGDVQVGIAPWCTSCDTDDGPRGILFLRWKLGRLPAGSHHSDYVVTVYSGHRNKEHRCYVKLSVDKLLRTYWFKDIRHGCATKNDVTKWAGRIELGNVGIVRSRLQRLGYVPDIRSQWAGNWE